VKILESREKTEYGKTKSQTKADNRVR